MKKIFEDVCAAILMIVISVVLFLMILWGLSMALGTDYEKGKYTMTYKVYYPNNVREYTVTNDYPIGMSSYKGTNCIYKIMENKTIKKTFYENKVISTTAPIEIVNYTLIKDNQKYSLSNSE